MKVLPIFRTHYSLGRSIITLAAPNKEFDPNYPLSVFDIAKKHDLQQVVVVDESVSGFLEALQNSEKAKVKLIYGLQLRCMDSITIKSESSLKTIHKLIVFIKNAAGYADLIKIASCAAKEGFYYKPNIDLTHLKKLWTDNLKLAVPFYDSFLFKNSIEGSICVPNFSFAQPTFFIEDSGLPFDGLLKKKVEAYASSFNMPTQLARSIYYYQRSDFTSYLTFRCINERTTLDKPQLEHMSSDNFCFECWKEQNG